MKYYKDTNNKPFVFEDNVTPEIIKRVENIHKTTLTEITQSEYEAMIAPTFEQVKEQKKSEIKTAFNNALKAGFVCSNGIKMDADINDISKLKAGFDLATTINATTLDVRDYDDITHYNLTLDEVNTMIVELGVNYQTLLKKKWDLEAQVNNAKTTAELEAIVW